MSTPTIPPAEALPLNALITPTEQGIASRVLARSGGGTLTHASASVRYMARAGGEGMRARNAPATTPTSSITSQSTFGFVSR